MLASPELPAAKLETAAVQVTAAAELQPFNHQVAGHSLMFCYEAGVVCKVTSDQEVAFYQTMPDLLRPHVPLFKGVVAVRVDAGSGEEQERGEVRNNKGTLTDKHVRRLETLTNSLHVKGKIYQFILLENLVEGYIQPCLLDLKLGLKPLELTKNPTRTATTLGLALCGMKVFQKKTGEVIQLNKADGRNMSEEDFRHAVRHFLYDGHDTRRELIPTILAHLYKLKAAINQLLSYRFYSSSLLIVYDADDSNGGKVDIRLVDFARTSHSGTAEERDKHEGLDYDSLRGLQTLIDVFSSL
ncbi:hypothetical protein ACOMHN_054076 [Nucella lapillus]